ncbi:MAG: radical SAM protein, partial [Bacillota bacterium]
MNKNEIIDFLRVDSQYEVQQLFDQARKAREREFGSKVFMYGFVYFSTWCRNNCNFCYYRNSNKIQRYRKEPEEIIAIAELLAESGVHLIDLTMGEDMSYHKNDFSELLKIVEQIKERTGLPVMLSPGLIEDEYIGMFAELGTEWYALYQETHNRA